MPTTEPAATSKPLPRSVAALARQFYGAPGYRARQDIMDAIRAEFPASNTTRASKRLRSSPEAKLFVRRVLACLRQPIIQHWKGMSDDVDDSQTYALRDLVLFDPAATVPLLRKLTRSSSPLVRKMAALHLPWTGLDRVIPDTKRFLASDDRQIAESAAQGIGLAAWHKLATPGFRKGLFDVLTPLLTGQRHQKQSSAMWRASGYAAESLIRLNRSRALPFLKSRACLHAANDEVWDILMKLHAERANHPRTFGPPIDPRVLWPLFDATRAATTGTAESRRAWTMALILTFTADKDPDRTRREARALERESVTWEGYKGTEEIKEARRRCSGIAEPEAMLGLLNRNPRAFPPPVAAAVRTLEFGKHLVDDGLVLYFHNCASSVDLALRGLRSLGFGAVAKDTRTALRIIQPRGSARAPRSIKRAVLAMTDAQQLRLDPLEKSVERRAPAIIAAAERFLEKQLGPERR